MIMLILETLQEKYYYKIWNIIRNIQIQIKKTNIPKLKIFQQNSNNIFAIYLSIDETLYVFESIPLDKLQLHRHTEIDV